MAAAPEHLGPGTADGPSRPRSSIPWTSLRCGSTSDARAGTGTASSPSTGGAKLGLLLFTHSMRTELVYEHSQIRVTMVQLTAVDTRQFSWCRQSRASTPGPYCRSKIPSFRQRPLTSHPGPVPRGVF